jgi:hypothetical protein
MVMLGGVVQQIGIVLAVGGYGVYVASTLLRLVSMIRWRTLVASTVVVGFHARAAGTLGLMTVLTGAVIKGTIPWPWLIAVFVFGAPALALLVVRPASTPQFGVEDSKKPS